MSAWDGLKDRWSGFKAARKVRAEIARQAQLAALQAGMPVQYVDDVGDSWSNTWLIKPRPMSKVEEEFQRHWGHAVDGGIYRWECYDCQQRGWAWPIAATNQSLLGR